MTRTIVIIAFLPKLDVAVMKFLKRQRGLSHVLWVLDPELVRECCGEVADCDAMEPDDVAKAVRSWNMFGCVKVADRRMFRFLHQPRACIVMPGDSISYAIADRYFAGYKMVFIPFEVN